ncbi:tyrosine recombinase XerC [Streptomyces rochei]|uniref:site-specific integrase n=1 Tax=Streptomyces TaxID=1883 RepID=UPI00109E4503|nr:site-specific integrase [Streptomyces sp. SS52]QCB25399.1 site-specific integrase [Streptomyces sp. SS52]
MPQDATERNIDRDRRLAKPAITATLGVNCQSLGVEAPSTSQSWRSAQTGGKRVVLSYPIKKLAPNAKGKVRYRFVVDAGPDPVTGKRKQLTRTFGTLREAKAEYASIVHRRYLAAREPLSQVTVDEWLDQWLSMKAEDLEESTAYSYTMTLARVRGRLGHIRLPDLTEDHVAAWMRWALQEGRGRSGKPGTGLGATSVEMSLARLKEALDRAVVRVNVAREVTVPRKARKAERRARAAVPPWTVAEVHAFVRAIAGDRLQAPFLLALMGLRPAEICGMRWADVDLDEATVSITNTRTVMGNDIVVEKATKSPAGERQLPLPGPVAAALTAFRGAQADERAAAGQGYEDSGYVLVDARGRVLNGRQLRERAYKVMDRSGLRRVRLYDARASCLTYLANHGVPDHLLARWAGHADARTTKRWYVKPDVDDLRPVADTWGGLASGSAPVHEENVRCGSVNG